VSNEHPFYPDFTIEEYWGADVDSNPHPDSIRVVMEVASVVRLEVITKSYEEPQKALAEFGEQVITQLGRYIDRAGAKGPDRVLGVTILGNQVALREFRDGKTGVILDIGTDWFDFFDPRFVHHLNAVRDRYLI
jgi:hypothetical protein